MVRSQEAQNHVELDHHRPPCSAGRGQCRNGALLPAPRFTAGTKRPLGQVRRYGEDELGRLRFIRRAQGMGFTLAEVAQLLTLTTNQACSATRALAAAKLGDIERRMAELVALRGELVIWIGACDANHEEACCPTLERLGEAPDEGGSGARTARTRPSARRGRHASV